MTDRRENVEDDAKSGVTLMRNGPTLNVRRPPDVGRSARKHREIMDAATVLFLRDGYRNTSMDQVASDAGVSKRTVYQHFHDKEQLFREIVLGVVANSEEIVTQISTALRNSDARTTSELRDILRDLARHYIDGVLNPRVLALRRLIIAEAERFPDLARTYYERGPACAIDVIAAELRSYHDRGLLQLDDAQLAAAHFAYLVLAIPQDQAQFMPNTKVSSKERDHLAGSAVRVFLAAYESPSSFR